MRVSLIFILALAGCDDETAAAPGVDLAIAGDLAGADSSGTVEPDL